MIMEVPVFTTKEYEIKKVEDAKAVPNCDVRIAKERIAQEVLDKLVKEGFLKFRTESFGFGQTVTATIYVGVPKTEENSINK